MAEIIDPIMDLYNPPIVDIYVDLEDFFKAIYDNQIVTEYNTKYTNKRFVIASQTINLAAHIRGYFRHRGIYARIFLVYAEDTNDNHRRYYKDFNSFRYKNAIDYEYKHNLINSQLELVKILAGYISGVYFIKKSSDFVAFVNSNNNPKIADKPIFLYTKSEYAYLLVDSDPNIYIMRPKKYRSEDNSFIVSNNNAVKIMYNSINQKYNAYLNSIPSGYLHILMTLTGNARTNIHRLCNNSTALKIVNDAICNMRILPMGVDPIFIYNNLYGVEKYCSLAEFSDRFNSIDLFNQLLIYNNSIESKDITWHIDLSDPQSLRNINNTYFADNPLDLNNL